MERNAIAFSFAKFYRNFMRFRVNLHINGIEWDLALADEQCSRYYVF